MSTKSPLRSVPIKSHRFHRCPSSLLLLIPPYTSQKICLLMTSCASRNVSIFSITIRVAMSPLRSWQQPSRHWASKNKQERSFTSCRLSHLRRKWISRPSSKYSASTETTSLSRACSSCSRSSTKTTRAHSECSNSARFARVSENVSLRRRSSKWSNTQTRIVTVVSASKSS